ncbi:MAG: alpha/beta hydrolase family protein [Planctomycetota bacterium]
MPLEPLTEVFWTFGRSQLVVTTRRDKRDLFRTVCLIRPDDMRVRQVNPDGYEYEHTIQMRPSRPDHMVLAFSRGREWTIQRVHVHTRRTSELWRGTVPDYLHWAVDGQLELMLLGQPGKHHWMEWTARTSPRAQWHLLPGSDEFRYRAERVLADGCLVMIAEDALVLVDLKRREARRMTPAEVETWFPRGRREVGVQAQAVLARAKAAVPHQVEQVFTNWFSTASVVMLERRNAKRDIWLYNDATGRAELLHATHRKLPLARRRKLRIPVAGGHSLAAMLVRPPGSGDEPLPTVLIGTNGDGEYILGNAFDPVSQWLANRGYAVLLVTGREPLQRQFRENGPRNLQDHLAALRWLVSAGHSVAGRIGVLACGTFDSYRALWLLTEAPELFAAGVISTTPVDLPRYVKALDQDYGKDRVGYGDVFTDGGAIDDAFLLQHSLIDRLPRRRAAVLLSDLRPGGPITMAGTATPRRLRQQCKAPVHQVMHSDHYAAIEAFFARQLGGRHEP